ncbi:hypothetical protein I0600191H4_12880 [Collinsella sp. i06-0019-1H4]
MEAASRSRSASDHRYGSIVLPELVRSRPFGRLKLQWGFFCYPGRYSAKAFALSAGVAKIAPSQISYSDQNPWDKYF